MVSRMQRELDAYKEEKGSPKGAHRFFSDIQIEFLIHELKDPVAVIETALRSVIGKKESYGELTPRQEKTLQRALRGSKKIRQMLNHLLEIGRSEAACISCLPFQPADAAAEVLMDVLETVAGPIFEQVGQIDDQDQRSQYLASCGIYLSLEPGLAELTVVQDETKFRQIMSNLIKNALDHRQEKTEIRLSLEAATLCIDIRDDGPGIAPEYHQLVFEQYIQLEPQLQTPRRRHGLGLAGARILARCLGGDIELYSKKGAGANFRLILPMTFKND